MNSKKLTLLREKIHSLEKPLVIFICGMPGTRKSSTAIKLAAALDIKVVVGTDQVRDIVRIYLKTPLLNVPSHHCWDLIGERKYEDIVDGYLLQASLLRKAVMANLALAENRGENMIFEGVHLCSAIYRHLQEHPIKVVHFLLYVGSEELHSKNINLKIDLRHGKEPAWSKEKLEDIREIQRFLIEFKKDEDCLIPSFTPEENVEKMLEELSCRLI